MDLIDRQAAIDAIRSADGVVHYWSKQNAIKVLEELPSAQPESAERNEESKQNVPNDDLISRKIVIEKFWHSEVEYRPTQIDDVMSILKGIPPAEPEQTLCADCKNWKYHDRRCKKWNHGVKSFDYCSYAERRTDG